MPRISVDTGMDLEFETFGDPSDPTLLLVNGYTSQLLAWPVELCEALVAHRLHVVRYDNRDVGLSTKLDGQRANPMSVQRRIRDGETPPPVPYLLSDMAADGVGLLSALGIEAAHVAGMSMGGMIVQTMAIEHPARIRSLTSIMSSPGDPAVGRPTPEARDALLAPPALDRETHVANSVRSLVWASKRFGDADEIRRRAAEDFDRMFYPEGSIRQLAAIYASPDRSSALAALTVPTLVLHGSDDTLITPDGGRRTAELVPGATYVELADMGHDLPRPLWHTLADLIGGHARRADAR
ncbi:MAG: alpha/beta fold hydrolase [Actinomycetota bacterium]